jgi:hypothetical protein
MSKIVLLRQYTEYTKKAHYLKLRSSDVSKDRDVLTGYYLGSMAVH